MNFCQNENKYEMKYYPIVEIKMVLRQPAFSEFFPLNLKIDMELQPTY
jgi:hypothetical protein